MEVDFFNLQINPETREIETSISPDIAFKYREKALLQQINLGKFAYGQSVKVGSSFAGKHPGNYNYQIDPLDTRWKFLDEISGKVNKYAIQTSDLKSYFFETYYTYQEPRTFRVDLEQKNWHTGQACYDFIQSKGDSLSKLKRCHEF